MRAFLSSLVVTPEGARPAAVLVENGRILDVVERHEAPAHAELIDVDPWVLGPGSVDSHVHINEPGRTEWEGYETATQAAAAGGVTTLVDMPLNCIPVTTTPEAFALKLEAAQPRLWVDCAFWGGVIPNHQEALRALCGQGIAGAKAFMCHSGIDDFPKSDLQVLREAMEILAATGLPLLVHAELESPVEPHGEAPGRAPGDEPPAPPSDAARQYATYLHARPPSFEDAAIAAIIALCRQTRCPVHIVHLSAATSLPLLARAKDEGLPITVETCPHYLCLEAEDIPEGATEFKCAPPIRGRENREALWQGLREGIIDLVVSDHSPCTPHLKLPERGDFLEAWGGIASLQLGRAAVWTEAHRRGFGLPDLARWMAARPAELAGLPQKGAIAKGRDADLVAWDPQATFQVQAQALFHRHPVTPYHQRTLRGVVHRTWLRGELVFTDGHPRGPLGQPLLRITP